MEKDTTQILSIYNETLFVDNILDQMPELLGKFEKKVLIFKNPKDENNECETMLNNMLKACGIGADDCYMAIIQQQEQTLELIKRINPEIILSFGIYIANEVFKLPPKINVVQKINNADVIIAMPLHTMLNDAAAKKNLWESLKKIFKI